MSEEGAEGATSHSTLEKTPSSRRLLTTEEEEKRVRREGEESIKKTGTGTTRVEENRSNCETDENSSNTGGSKAALAENTLAPEESEVGHEEHNRIDDVTSVASEASSEARIEDGRSDNGILKKKTDAVSEAPAGLDGCKGFDGSYRFSMGDGQSSTGRKRLHSSQEIETRESLLMYENETLKRSLEEMEKRMVLKETSRLTTYNRMRDKSAKERRVSKEFDDFKKTFAATSRVSFIKITKLHNTPPLIKALHERLYDHKVFDSMLAKDPIGLYKGLSFKGAPLVGLFSKPSNDLTLWDENVDFFVEI